MTADSKGNNNYYWKQKTFCSFDAIECLTLKYLLYNENYFEECLNN